MKFETLKKDHRKNIIIGTLIIILIIMGVWGFVGTRAKYRYTATYQAVQGTINYEEPDLWVTALYIQQEDGSYTSSGTIPTSGYTLNETETYCGYSSVNGLVKDETIKVTYENGNIKISDITKGGTKCHIYFDKVNPYASRDTILANNTVDTSRKSGIFTGIFETNTAGKIFEGPADDYGDTTYFFAGSNPNNWVQFAGKWWRIIRINGDGSVRLIYAGSDSAIVPQLTGEDTQIGTSAFNTQYNDNAYVGYMYGTSGSDNYNDTHANINSSAVKVVLDTWYENNIVNNAAYSSKIESNVGFCGDRTMATEMQNWWGIDTKRGYGEQTTAYISFSRSLTVDGEWNPNQTALLKCAQNNDLYTISGAAKGNKALTFPVGLIARDEAIFAGSFGAGINTGYYLYTNLQYWTMSSSYYNSNDGKARVFIVGADGGIDSPGNGFVNNILGVRPVINIKANTQLTGSGTTTDPYVVN